MFALYLLHDISRTALFGSSNILLDLKPQIGRWGMWMVYKVAVINPFHPKRGWGWVRLVGVGDRWWDGRCGLGCGGGWCGVGVGRGWVGVEGWGWGWGGVGGVVWGCGGVGIRGSSKLTNHRFLIPSVVNQRAKNGPIKTKINRSHATHYINMCTN